MSHVAIRLGISGSVINTAVDFKHAAESIMTHFGNSSSFSDFLAHVVHLDNATFTGIVFYGTIIGAAWLPAVLALRNRLRRKIGLPAISLGVVGATVTTVIETRYGIAAMWEQFGGHRSSASDFVSYLITMDNTAFAGVTYYVVLLVLTWLPLVVLLKKRIVVHPQT
jgi:hypothetical protein